MNKKTLVLGGVLILLIALAYIYQGPLKQWQKNFSQPKNILAKIDADKIDKLEIISGGETIVLGKAGEKWKYNNSKDFFVDPSLMLSLLQSLKQAADSKVEMVSNNRERKSEFKTDDQGVKLKISSQGKILADFIVGDIANFYDSYISGPELAATYLVKSDLAQALRPAEWRDSTIFFSDEEKITKIRFQYPNREFTVELKDGRWSGVLPEKFSVDQEKINKIRQIMSGLRAEAIPEQTFSGTGLEKHSIIVQATGEGIDNVIMIGQGREDLFFAKRGDSDNIYLIKKSDRDELDKWIWQLK